MLLNTYEHPNILFLRGCFLDDCESIEDMFDERIMRSVADENCAISDSIIYDDIPLVFTSVDKWIKKTNLKCWTCDCTFHTVPIFVPNTMEISKDVYPQIVKMDVIGNFCAWTCASYWIHLHYTRDEKWEKLKMLNHLYKLFTNKSVNYIEKSPQKTCMVQYGGHVTVSKYKEMIAGMNPTLHHSTMFSET